VSDPKHEFFSSDKRDRDYSLDERSRFRSRVAYLIEKMQQKSAREFQRHFKRLPLAKNQKRPMKAHHPCLEKLLIQFLFRFEISVSELSDHSREAIKAPK